MAQPIDEAAFRERYAIGPGFLAAYLAYWNTNCPQYAVTSPADIERLPPPYSYWIEYALSTNLRGDAIYELLAPHRRPGAASYLDVGCGFGGCVVVFARHGLTARGIDIDPQRIDFARINTRDAGLLDAVRVMDVLSDEATALGRFDAITCTDVIEHVLDPRRALERMIELLSAGGVLLLEIPNKDSLNFVACDGHFGLFGIVLLDRPHAMRLHAAHFQTPYDVGHYHELSFYRELARGRGCEAFTIDNPLHPVGSIEDVQARWDRAVAAFRDFERNGRRKLDRDLADLLVDRFAAYRKRFERDRAALSRRPEELEPFRQRYLADFWTLIVRKR